jgi:hypothetical protein
MRVGRTCHRGAVTTGRNLQAAICQWPKANESSKTGTEQCWTIRGTADKLPVVGSLQTIRLEPTIENQNAVTISATIEILSHLSGKQLHLAPAVEDTTRMELIFDSAETL